MNTIVVYKSISGFTKKYAQWIAKELNAVLYKKDNITVRTLLKYETVIYGGSLHAVGIIGLDLIKKNFEALKDKNIIVFATGASPFKDGLIKEIFSNNFCEDQKETVKVFYLRGGFNFDKLNERWLDNFLFKILVGTINNPLARNNISTVHLS